MSQRQRQKEVRGITRTMRETQHEDLTVAQAMRDYGRLIYQLRTGRELMHPFYPPHLERILDRAHRAECKKRFRTAARLMSHFFTVLVATLPEERAGRSSR